MRLHLLYARFWHKFYMILAWFLQRTFPKLYNQGMILGENNEKCLNHVAML